MRNELVVYTGPMWSGKSARLISAVERHRLRKTAVVCFKPAIDGRYSETAIVTHSGFSIPAFSVSSGKDIIERVKRFSPDVVAIDEAFMIDGCADAVREIFKSKISVYISSIELSANMQTFPEMEKILSIATRIEKCAAVCVRCGEDAHLTHRIVPSLEEISVGGADTYEPLCWNCHPLASI